MCDRIRLKNRAELSHLFREPDIHPTRILLPPPPLPDLSRAYFSRARTRVLTLAISYLRRVSTQGERAGRNADETGVSLRRHTEPRY